MARRRRESRPRPVGVWARTMKPHEPMKDGLLRAVTALTLGLLALAMLAERAVAANLGNNEIQLLWGSGFKLGSAAPDKTDVLTLTINHSSTRDYGSISANYAAGVTGS